MEHSLDEFDALTDSPYESLVSSPFEAHGFAFDSALRNVITTNPRRRQRKTTRTRPCTCCRRRKTKCVVLPHSRTCLECSKRNMDCIFESAVDEPTKALMCDNCNHRRTTCTVPKGSSICTECTLRDLPCRFSDSVNANAKIRTNIPIRDYDEYQGHTILKKTLSLQGPKSSKMFGASSIVERNLLSFTDDSTPNSAASPTVVLATEQIQIGAGCKLRKLSDDTVFRITNDNEEYIRLSYSQVDEIEQIVYPFGLALLELFFNRVHPLVPVISRPAFLEKYSRTHREFDPMLLAMVYLHAINMWHLADDLKDLEKPNFEKLERLVLTMYSENVLSSTPKFSSCQGLILLMHYNFKGSAVLFREDDYWKKMSQLVTICEELGLNHNSDDWLTIPNWERRVRKVLTWALIMMDKTYSIMESRPSRISADNWVLNELEAQDFQVRDDEEVYIEKTDGENYVVNHGKLKVDSKQTELSLFGNLIFAKMVHWSYHVNDALSSIYNLKSIKFDDFSTVLSKSDTLLTNLTNWYESLPNHIKDIQIVENQLSTASFNLSYYLLHVLIHRRVLNSLIDNVGILADEEFTKFKSRFKTIVALLSDFNTQFIAHLSNEHFLNCFWYSTTTTALINVAIMHQLLIKATREELYIDDEVTDDTLLHQYATYINSLREFEPVSQSVGRALNHIYQYS